MKRAELRSVVAASAADASAGGAPCLGSSLVVVAAIGRTSGAVLALLCRRLTRTNWATFDTSATARAMGTCNQMGRKWSSSSCSSMMLSADWKMERQQKLVFTIEKISIHSSSPHSGMMPISTKLDSRLTISTPMP